MRVPSELSWVAHTNERINWDNVWKSKVSKLHENFLRDFVWKVTHRILPVNSRLHSWAGMKVTPNCKRCGQIETLEHALLECPEVKQFWRKVAAIITRINGKQILLEDKVVFLGIFQSVNLHAYNLINYIMDVAKLSCWKNRVSINFEHNKLVSLEGFFKSYVKNRLVCEKELLATKHSTIKCFCQRWCIGGVLAKVEDEKIVFQCFM